MERYLTLPEGCYLQAATIENTRSREGAALIEITMGSLEKAFETIFGYYLVQGDTSVSESITGSPVNGILEMGVEIYPNFRKRGYAMCICAAVIREAEGRGYRTYWNCNSGNEPSVRLARKLGYRTERVYRFIAWSRMGAGFRD